MLGSETLKSIIYDVITVIYDAEEICWSKFDSWRKQVSILTFYPLFLLGTDNY